MKRTSQRLHPPFARLVPSLTLHIPTLHAHILTPHASRMSVHAHICTPLTTTSYSTLPKSFPRMVGIEYNVKIIDIEPLTEGQWIPWSCNIRFCFLEAGFVHYLDGMNAPDESDSKKVQAEWHTINSQIISTLAKHVSPALKQELDKDMLAADAWRMLKSGEVVV